MADLYPVAGCRIFIGPATATQAADFVEADLATLSPYTEIDGWTQMGDFGDNSALITQALINRGRDVKLKGTKNAGSMQNIFANLPDDAGQIAVIAAAQTQLNYAFKVLLNDGDTTVSPDIQPSERYFVGLIMSAVEVGGEANTPRNLQVNVEINSNIVQVAAAA